MEIGPERLSIPLRHEAPAGHLDSKSISAPVERLGDLWPASSVAWQRSEYFIFILLN